MAVNEQGKLEAYYRGSVMLHIQCVWLQFWAQLFPDQNWHSLAAGQHFTRAECCFPLRDSSVCSAGDLSWCKARTWPCVLPQTQEHHPSQSSFSARVITSSDIVLMGKVIFYSVTTCTQLCCSLEVLIAVPGALPVSCWELPFLSTLEFPRAALAAWSTHALVDLFSTCSCTCKYFHSVWVHPSTS